jgi:hypothetical protein
MYNTIEVSFDDVRISKIMYDFATKYELRIDALTRFDLDRSEGIDFDWNAKWNDLFTEETHTKSRLYLRTEVRSFRIG